MEPTEIIDALVVNRNLVFRFFALFSRFEYSLKRSGFLKAAEKAEPNWDTYANTLQGLFQAVSDPAFQAAVAFLVKEPPKTQIVSNLELGWRDSVQGPGEHFERYILRLVTTVRNNLFHGGKYPHPFGPVRDIARNRRLLEASISVLCACLVLSDKVRSAFEEVA
jgi:hypothetical protein